MATTTHNLVKDYYTNTLATKADLQTSACCCDDERPQYVKDILASLPDEILARSYGCGSPIPDALTGCTVVDLGCGTGQDAFVLSKLVGETGRVIGVDMTEEQLDVAKRYQSQVAKSFGFKTSNVTFKQGYIEDLESIDIADESVDVIVSNCVINLSPNKPQVFREMLRVLKPGGELYFSDVFSASRIPAELMNDPVLLGECISGAMYIEDFRRLLIDMDVPDYRVVASRPLEITNQAVAEKLGTIHLTSQTVRAFKLLSLEDRCEDYGQVATYRGSVPHAPDWLSLDDLRVFATRKPMRVCGNTAAMLQETRFGKHFDVKGDRSQHFGLFDCGETVPTTCSSGGCC